MGSSVDMRGWELSVSESRMVTCYALGEPCKGCEVYMCEADLVNFGGKFDI